jgi:hypothetical protein
LLVGGENGAGEIQGSKDQDTITDGDGRQRLFDAVVRFGGKS